MDWPFIVRIPDFNHYFKVDSYHQQFRGFKSRCFDIFPSKEMTRCTITIQMTQFSGKFCKFYAFIFSLFFLEASHNIKANVSGKSKLKVGEIYDKRVKARNNSPWLVET